MRRAELRMFWRMLDVLETTLVVRLGTTGVKICISAKSCSSAAKSSSGDASLGWEVSVDARVDRVAAAGCAFRPVQRKSTLISTGDM